MSNCRSRPGGVHRYIRWNLVKEEHFTSEMTRLDVLIFYWSMKLQVWGVCGTKPVSSYGTPDPYMSCQIRDYLAQCHDTSTVEVLWTKRRVNIRQMIRETHLTSKRKAQDQPEGPWVGEGSPSWIWPRSHCYPHIMKGGKTGYISFWKRIWECKGGLLKNPIGSY
jgi:hypothetical protein